MFNFRKRQSSLVRASHAVIEGLEGRQMLSASLSHHGVLNVRGTGQNDVITLAPNAQDAQSVDVSVNGKVSTFSKAMIQKVKVNAGAGDDVVTLDSSITAPATLNGGAGNDTLTAGGGDDSLMGGPGNDTLQGGTGADTLAGGTGDDTCVSGSGPSAIDGGRGHDHIQFNPTAGVALSTLPAAIQAGLTTLAQGATITTVQTFHEDGHNYYGTEVAINGVNTRIVVDSNGNLVTQAADDHQGGNDGEGDHGGAFGTVVSVTSTTVTLTETSEHHSAKQATFSVTPTTTITADGNAIPLSSLSAGASVGIQTSSTDATVATAITAVNRRIEGTVTSADTTANTITLTGEDGTAATYTVASTAIITVDGTNSPLSAIAMNSRAHLTLAALDATSVIGIRVDTQGGGGDTNGNNGGDNYGGDGGHHDQSEVAGSVLSVDTVANTITLHTDVAASTTYTLTSTTVITLDESPSTLSALTAGVDVELKLSADGLTVLSINAESHH